MRKIPNYMEDFDAAKQLARQTAEEAKRAGRASRWTDSPTIHREDATTQRGRVVPGEQVWVCSVCHKVYSIGQVISTIACCMVWLLL